MARKPSLCCAGLAIGFLARVAQVHACWPFATGDINFTSPSIADIDGDGALEIVFSSFDGNAYCLDIGGQPFWVTPLHDLTGFPPQLSSSATLVDLDGNPTTLEVVVGSGRGFVWGRLYILSSTGDVLATFDTPTKIGSSALVTDLENDGITEIIFGTSKYDQTPPAKLYCLSVQVTKGEIQLSERWSVSLKDGTLLDAPSLSDFGNDGISEIVVSLGGTVGTSSDNSALYCLNADGQVIWSFDQRGSFSYNTPAICDLDQDDALEVLVAPFNGDLHCLDGLTGAVKWTFPNPGASFLDSPSIADLLNADGMSETVIDCYGAERLFGIYDDGSEAWEHVFAPEWTGYSSAGIADVDGDGDLEIAIGTGMPPSLGAAHMYLFDHSGQIIWSTPMPNRVFSSPALADLDGDGFLEIAFGCHDHNFYVLDHNGDTFVPNPMTKPTDLAPWPTYRQNNQRTGYYARPGVKPPIPGDITKNGIVDVDDLLEVINAWGKCPLPPDPCDADVVVTGIVDVDDLLEVINNWS